MRGPLLTCSSANGRGTRAWGFGEAPSGRGGIRGVPWIAAEIACQERVAATGLCGSPHGTTLPASKVSRGSPGEALDEIRETPASARLRRAVSKVSLTTLRVSLTAVGEPLTAVNEPVTMVNRNLTVVHKNLSLVNGPVTAVNVALTLVNGLVDVVNETLNVVNASPTWSTSQ